MRNDPKENEIYRHFKGNDYQIVTLATHSETRETLVVYRALYGEGEVYARPLDMFMSEVDRDKYPEATQKYRFEKEEFAVDPVVMEFLDCSKAAEKLVVLSRLESRVTDSMIDTMAMSLDIEIKEGPIKNRFEDLKSCLTTLEKYETTRLR